MSVTNTRTNETLNMQSVASIARSTPAVEIRRPVTHFYLHPHALTAEAPRVVSDDEIDYGRVWVPALDGLISVTIDWNGRSVAASYRLGEGEAATFISEGEYGEWEWSGPSVHGSRPYATLADIRAALPTVREQRAALQTQQAEREAAWQASHPRATWGEFLTHYAEHGTPLTEAGDTL